MAYISDSFRSKVFSLSDSALQDLKVESLRKADKCLKWVTTADCPKTKKLWSNSYRQLMAEISLMEEEQEDRLAGFSGLLDLDF